MSGLSIGLGVGLKYSTPKNNSNGFVPTPSPDDENISDALLLENGQGVLFLDDGSYLKLEITEVSTQSTNKINKSYWNF